MRQGARRRPLVLFAISNGWGIRNIIHTGLLDSVNRFADVGVAVSADLAPFFEDIQREARISLVLRLPTEEKRVWRWVRQAKKAIFQARHDISTARIKWLQNASGGTFAQQCRFGLWRLWSLCAARWQIRLLEKLECLWATGGIEIPQDLPQLFVNCSPFDFRDNWLMRTLHREGVPSVSMIPSWDNPSTKGCIVTSASRVLVWGDHQKRELMGYYPWLRDEQIRVSGIPQFDAYHLALEARYGRDEFLARLSIPKETKVILYATCSESLFPNEPDIVGDLVDAITSERLGSNAHVLIRCHPADRKERYAHLAANKNVTIFPSSLNTHKNLYSWIPPRNEIAMLAAMLTHSSVCINTASTMTLDAFACGKPVVNIAYDGRAQFSYFKSVRRYYDYHHYSPIMRSGAVPLARSAQELEEFVAEALAQPDKRRQQRAAIVDEFCAYPDGGSLKYIEREIFDMLK
jgi:hypothetical protein